MGVRLGLVASFLLPVWVASAHANPTAEGVAAEASPPSPLTYRAAPGCPSWSALRPLLTDRASHSTEATAAVAIEIQRRGAVFVGTLTLDGELQARREISGTRCEDVASALALIAALALDRQEGAPVAAGPGRRSSAPDAATATATTTTTTAAADRRAPRRWLGQALGGGLVAQGITPGATFAAMIGGRLERRGLAHLWLAGIFGADTEPTSMGDVRFLWTAARGGVCWRPEAVTIGAELCFDLELGRLKVDALDAVRATEAARLWATAGVHFGAEWPKTTRAFLHAQAGVSLPLQRDHLYLTPNLNVHTTPLLVPWLAIGGGVRFR